MRRRGFLIGSAATATSGLLRAEDPGLKVREFEWRIFDRINDLRGQCGAPELEWVDAIYAETKEQSERKAQLRFAGHVDPQRGDVAERLSLRGLVWSRCGENLFMEKGYDDPVNLAVVCWWYSKGHRENLLNPEYSESAVGIVIDPEDRIFATQIFMTPPIAGLRAGKAGSAGPKTQKSPAAQGHRAHDIFEKLLGRG